MAAISFTVEAPRLSMAQIGKLAEIFPDLQLIHWSAATDCDGYSTGNYSYEFLGVIPEAYLSVCASYERPPYVVADIAGEIARSIRDQVTSKDVQNLRVALQPLYESWLDSIPALTNWRLFPAMRARAYEAGEAHRREVEERLADTVREAIYDIVKNK